MAFVTGRGHGISVPTRDTRMVLRHLGFRTIYEIEQERNALKALRGDFTRVDEASDKAGAAPQAVQTTS